MTPKTAFYGQDFNVVGAVLFTGVGPPMGDYLFYDNGIPICTLPYSQAMCTSVNDNFEVGVHSFTVAYSGDATNAASSMSPAVSMTFVPDITATTVATSGTPVYQGQSIAFTATVTGNHAAPVGPVVFSIDGTPAATVALVPSTTNDTSTASFTTTTLSPGTHTITVSYAATLDFLASVSAPALTQVVLPILPLPSTVTLTCATTATPCTAGFGDTVSFTATITLNPPAGNTQPLPSGPATGTVSFFDGATLLQTSTVNPATGIATFNTATLAIGTHVITAQYSGDSFYLPGSSTAVIATIHVHYNGPPDFTLTISQNPLVVGVGMIPPGSVTVTVVAINGWTNDVALACPSNLPYETTCTLGQTTFSGGNGMTTLTMTSMSPHDCGSSRPYFMGTARLEMRFGGAALAGLVMLLLPRRRRVLKGLLLALLCVLPGVTGCAGNCTDLGTLPGTYTIPITATGVGTTTTHTVDLQMQVNL
jgi:hypothetical protein